MLTFHEFITETSATDVGRAVVGPAGLTDDQESDLEHLFKVVRLGMKAFPTQVMQFMRRLGTMDPAIQAELDQMSSRTGAVRMAAGKGLGDVAMGDKGDEIARNVADGGSMELP